MAFVYLVLAGAAVFAAYRAGLITPTLRKRVASANPLAGKTRAQIEALIGPPNGVSAQPGGKVLLQWMQSGYHIALRFDANGICEGVTHEFSAR